MRMVSMVLFALVAALLVGSPARGECPPVRDGSCHLSLSASFTYANSEIDDKKDKLSFKMSNGESAMLSDFGDPTDSTNYELCIYANNVRVGSMSIAADGDCSAGGCWVLKPKGVAFKDKTGTPDGIIAMTLAASSDFTADKTKIGVKGKGANLDQIDIPLAEPVIVQVRNSLDECWGAAFEGAEQVAQDTTKRKAKMKAKLDTFPSCSDGVQNGFESDIDCGGDCVGCAYTRPCLSDGDCFSGSCTAGACAAGCNDGVLNGDETAIDCGGSCQQCTFGRACTVNSDCVSNYCRNATTCSNKLVFVTSTSYNGNLGGLAGADSKCAARASAANLGGTWRAWVSTNAVAAIDRIADHAYYDMFGLQMFAGKSQIQSQAKPTFGIAYNELKGDVGNAFAWTGTRNDGAVLAPNCSDWTSTSGFGWFGEPNFPIAWSAYGNYECTNSNRLICFEQ